MRFFCAMLAVIEIGNCAMSLEKCLNQSKDLGVWLHSKTNEKEFSNNVRERSALSILQLAEDTSDAIIILLEAKLPGPSLSLARPLFEAYVRGLWLLRYASDEQVSKFLEGNCPNFPGLLAAIGKDKESGGAWIHAISEKNLRNFHDLTHGGHHHVLRRITADSMEPNYPEKELETLIEFANEIRIRIGCETLLLLNDEDAIQDLQNRAHGLRMHLEEPIPQQ